MNEKDYLTINIWDICRLLYRKIPAILISIVIGALVGFAYITKMVTPLYQAQATLIVNTQQESNTQITNDQYSSARNWVITYSMIFVFNHVRKF